MSKILPKGISRLFAIIPIVILNLILPLNLHTMHLGGSSAFFLAWLTNFKLLMLAFGNGPLSQPSISFPRFAILACFPIKFQSNSEDIKENPSQKDSKKGLKSIWNYVTKVLLICLFLKLYGCNHFIHPKLMWVIYSFHIYFGLEILLAIVGGFAKAIVGIELEPQFDDPYLSTSLQEFWGRRWNIMVTKILWPTVYEPVLKFCTWIMGRKWASMPAIFCVFLVSGLMHELIFFYLGRGRPSGELIMFFVLHGVCLAIEVAIKKAIKGRWGLHWTIARPLTIGFVMITAFWLFFPEFLRCNPIGRAVEEYGALDAFVRDVSAAVGLKSFSSEGS
ncbi:hypothetical protein ACJIZ3_014580 [Penstemon smallii]|uniref:Wax synthase domain-containing protein n=1 Tax=Penstemon smallii TaxID=265156 RepID=A0ABD3RJZ9_9LAMI